MQRIKELDVLRGLAAFIVMLFHCTMFRPEAENGFFLGIAGVDLFFMISGFVISMSVEQRPGVKRYLKARAIRIFPAYWLSATIIALTYMILDMMKAPVPYRDITIEEYLVNLTMLQYYAEVANVSSSYWTLIIEWLFYVLVAAILIVKAGAKLMQILTAVSLALSIYLFVIGKKGDMELLWWFPLGYHLPLFVSGIAFYRLYQSNSGRLMPVAVIALCFGLQIPMAEFGRTTQFMSMFWYAAMLVIFNCLFVLMVAGMLKKLVCRTTLFFGDISYSLYLIHQPVCYCIVIPWLTDHLGVNFWVSAFLIAIPLTVGISSLITYYFEFPARRFLRRKWIREEN